MNTHFGSYRFKFSYFYLIIPIGLLIAGYELLYNPLFDIQSIDTSFITGQPCAPPCWQELILDRSTSHQVKQKINTLPFVVQATVREWSEVSYLTYSDAHQIYYECKGSEGQICGTIVTANDTLKQVSHRVSYYLSLKEVITKLGAPEYVIHHPSTPHGDGCTLIFVWSKKNIWVESDTKVRSCFDLEKGKPLDPNVLISYITYIAPEVFNPDYCRQSSCVPWPGVK